MPEACTPYTCLCTYIIYIHICTHHINTHRDATIKREALELGRKKTNIGVGGRWRGTREEEDGEGQGDMKRET